MKHQPPTTTKTVVPRKWQMEAIHTVLEGYLFGSQTRFLIEAGVGSGKTMFAALLAKALRGRLPKVVTIAPQYMVKRGFVETFAIVDIQLDHLLDSTRLKGFQGFSMTYQGLMGDKAGTRLLDYVDENTLVILDEPHHLREAEDSAWYAAAVDRLGHAGLIVLMTGTPFREGEDAIPFCNYRAVGNTRELVPDYSYTYADSVRDRVCVKVKFRMADGEGVWQERKGDGKPKLKRRRTGDMMTQEEETQLLKILLDPNHDFVRKLLGRFLESVQEMRATTPNAAGLVVCVDIKHAKAVSKVLESMGVEHAMFTNDLQCHAELTAFKTSRVPVAVAVKIISEGTDIPRLKSLAYLSNVRSRLFLMQVLGRIVRSTQPDTEERCEMILPNIPMFSQFVAMLEEGLSAHSVRVQEEEDPEEEQDDESGGGAEFKDAHKSIDILSAKYGGMVDTELFGGFEYQPDSATPLADRKEFLRKVISEMAQGFGVEMASKYPNTKVGDMIHSTHKQLNTSIGVDNQADMDLDELMEKYMTLKEWYADNGVRRKVPALPFTVEDAGK